MRASEQLPPSARKYAPHVGILRGRTGKNNLRVLEMLALGGPYAGYELAREQARERAKKPSHGQTQAKTSTVYRRLDHLLRKGYARIASERYWRPYKRVPLYAITFKSAWLLALVSDSVFAQFGKVWGRHRDLFHDEPGWSDKPTVPWFPEIISIGREPQTVTLSRREAFDLLMEECWPQLTERLKLLVREQLDDIVRRAGPDYDDLTHMELNEELAYRLKRLLDQFATRPESLNLSEEDAEVFSTVFSKIGLRFADLGALVAELFEHGYHEMAAYFKGEKPRENVFIREP